MSQNPSWQHKLTELGHFLVRTAEEGERRYFQLEFLLPPPPNKTIYGIPANQLQRLVKLAEQAEELMRAAGLMPPLGYVVGSDPRREAYLMVDELRLLRLSRGQTVQIPKSPDRYYKAIQDAIEAEATTEPSEETRSPRGKGGRPKLPSSEADKRREVVDDWQRAKSAGTCQKDFCRDRGIRPEYLTKSINWCAQRARRSNQTA